MLLNENCGLLGNLVLGLLWFLYIHHTDSSIQQPMLFKLCAISALHTSDAASFCSGRMKSLLLFSEACFLRMSEVMLDVQ